MFRLWLGNHFVDRILKSSHPNTESESDITHPVAPGNGRQDGIGVHPIRLSAKHGV